MLTMKFPPQNNCAAILHAKISWFSHVEFVFRSLILYPPSSKVLLDLYVLIGYSKQTWLNEFSIGLLLIILPQVMYFCHSNR